MTMLIKHPVNTKNRRAMAIRYLKGESTLANVTEYLGIERRSGRNVAANYVVRALKEAVRAGEITVK